MGSERKMSRSGSVLLTLVLTLLLWLFIDGQFERYSGERGDGRERGIDRAPRGSAAAARAVPIRIEVYEFGLNPSRTFVKAGQAVVFRNVGEELHEIRPDSAAGERAFAAAREHGSSRPVLSEPGSYPIYCAIHPQIRGRIEVVEDF